MNTFKLNHCFISNVSEQSTRQEKLSDYTIVQGMCMNMPFFQHGILTAGSSSGNWLEFNEEFCRDKVNRLNTNQPFKTKSINASGA